MLHAKPLTPCVGRCSLSFGGEICNGCGRSVEQVRDWNTYTDEEKRRIMDELQRRKDDDRQR